MKAHKHGKVEMRPVRYEEDRPAAENPVKIQDLSFRDGHQSLFATRGRNEDMLAVAQAMDQVGFYSMEVWGGATFDTTHRFLNEDPWERLRLLKRVMVKTPLSMLLRGQNLVGYRNYPDDVVEAFVERACDNGMDIFRVFDALNDFRNFETAVRMIKKNGRHFQGTICYSLTEMRMGGEVYTLDYYLEKARALQEMGADSICIKDMAGLIAPYDAYTLVAALKSEIKVPLHLHSHFTSGMADLSLLKAIEAGVDVVDTCLSPYAYRTSHPAVEPLVVSLLGTNRDTGLSLPRLVGIAEQMERQIPKYLHYANQSRYAVIDPNVILHQTPGGMLSNLVNQLQAMGELRRLEEVFHALPQVRKELGQVPLVTPTSQIVGTQTVNNVLFDGQGERYRKITQQVRDLCYGLYGKTPRPVDSQVQNKALEGYPRGETPITVRPGEILEPELPTAREHIGELARDLDDLLIFALFPITGRRFLRWKYGEEEVPPEVRAKSLEEVQQEQELVRKALAGELVERQGEPAPAAGPPAAGEAHGGAAPAASGRRVFDVYVDGQRFRVEVAQSGVRAAPAGAAAAQASAGAAGPAAGGAPADVPPAPAAGQEAITAPMPGMIVSYEKREGESVSAGQTVVVMEAMKMHNSIEAGCDGVVEKVLFAAGDSVAKGAVLALIRRR